MNLKSIVITNLIGVTIILILFVNGYRMLRNKQYEMKIFHIMLWIILSSCLAEMSSYIVDGRSFPGAIPLNLFLNSYLYIANVSYTAIWIKFVDYKLNEEVKRLKKNYRWLNILVMICTAAVIGNVFGHYLFYIDEFNIYHRTPASYIFFILPISGQLFAISMVNRAKRASQGLEFFPIWSFLCPFLIGVVVQAAVYGISIAWCGAAIGLCSLYMSLQNKLIYDDALTGLYNRYYLRTILSTNEWNSSEQRSGIMLDVDFFKEINDTWGHSTGDEALCDVANILKASIPENAIAIRYAGDEFIILLMTNNEQEIKKVLSDIQDSIKEFNERNERPYKLSVSMGTSVYQTEKTAEDLFLENMDKHMYEEKERKHHEYMLKNV